jgi:hypothetical protein
MANPVDAVLNRSLAEDTAWANACLPPMGLCNAAYAALMTESKTRHVPIPVGMPAPDHTPARYERAAQQHIYALQDGNASRERVTVVDTKRGLATLVEAELAELNAAAQEREAPDGTLPPRATAVTVLVHSANPTLQRAALDATAVLATCPADDEEGTCGAQHTRIAFLTGEPARTYARERSKIALAQVTTSGSIEVCVLWGDELPPPEAGGSSGAAAVRVRIRAEFAALESGHQRPERLLYELRTTVRGLWNAHAHYSATTRVLRTYPNPCKLPGSKSEMDAFAGFENAYERSVTWTARRFFDRLRPPVHVELSAATKAEDYSGKLMHSGMYVRIVPYECKDKQGKEILNDQRAFFGMLLHKRPLTAAQLAADASRVRVDYANKARSFCERIREDEFQGNPHAICGLRAPQSAEEWDIGLHILYARHGFTDLGPLVSAYGQSAAAGKSFDSVNGASVSTLNVALVPLDARIKENNFLLPCLRPIQNAQEHAHNSALMAVLEAAILEIPDVVAPPASDGVAGAHPASASGPERALRLVPPECESWPQVDVHVATEAQLCTRNLLGVSLDSPSLRVGDAQQAVCEERGPSPVAELLGAIAQAVGPDAPVEEGIALATQLVRSRSASRAEDDEDVPSKRARCGVGDIVGAERLTAKGVKALMAGKGFKWQFDKITVLKNAKQRCAPKPAKLAAAVRLIEDALLVDQAAPALDDAAAYPDMPKPENVVESDAEAGVERLVRMIGRVGRSGRCPKKYAVLVVATDSRGASNYLLRVDEKGEPRVMSTTSLANADSAAFGVLGYMAEERHLMPAGPA